MIWLSIRHASVSFLWAWEVSVPRAHSCICFLVRWNSNEVKTSFHLFFSFIHFAGDTFISLCTGAWAWFDTPFRFFIPLFVEAHRDILSRVTLVSDGRLKWTRWRHYRRNQSRATQRRFQWLRPVASNREMGMT